MIYSLKLADYAQKQGEVPVGAVLIQDEKVIGEGWNQRISQYDPTAHAEIIALRQGGKILKNYRLLKTTLYVTLEPCLMCMGAMIHSRISRLVYGTKDKKNSLMNSKMDLINNLNINHHIKIDHNIMADECSIVLKNFFRLCRERKKIHF
ncbi:tRNA adenosine(34) deaminase TadA [Pantoea sp. Mhis]|nr:tRNA adenosine(34) deaminase TadA [Pantoea sp. Mhis]MXP56605.1 tRNA adenosine(34) deaminase TadA [Pantoea sp. Mhis]